MRVISCCRSGDLVPAELPESARFAVPAFFFAIVAYLTSFIPPVFGIGLRSNVNIVVLLSVFALNNGVKSSMPLVSYATYIDIWMFACFIAVFFALLMTRAYPLCMNLFTSVYVDSLLIPATSARS